MKHTLCCCSPAYGAMMHALPRDASALKRMTEKQIIDQATPWVNRVPPQTEVKLHAWAAKAINPDAKGLGDLGDLAELEGFSKRLKKFAKKITSGVKKVAKKVVVVHKKAAKALTSKKLLKPFAFAVGAVTGTLPAMMELNKIRDQVRAQRKAAQAQTGQTGQTDEQIEAEAKAEAQAQLRAEEQAQAQQQAQQQAAPVYQPQYTTQQSFAPVQPQYQAPQKQNFVTAQAEPFANFNNVQRIAPADQEDRLKIVGISRKGIMESIKANPIPWTVGGLSLVFILSRAMNQSPYQRAY